MGREAMSIGADTFQFFTRNPRGCQMKPVDPADSEALRALMEKEHFAPILAHAPYTLNACAADPTLRSFAKNVMAEDLKIMDTHVPGNMYNFHPGSHVRQGAEAGIGMILEHLNAILYPELKTKVLLETMSGKGSEVGRNFEEIAKIIDGTELDEHLGVCLDTCHVFSAGYDIVGHLDDVLDEFDSVIGLGRLSAIHLNDSMTPFASNKDRHACIGEGSIGLSAIIDIINEKRLRKLPFYLETPNDLSGYAYEIEMLRGNFKDD